MIARDIVPSIRADVATRPVVTIRGPRQCGKTTLVRSAFPNFNYANLESPDVYSVAMADYKKFFVENPAPLVIDEIQKVPHLTSAIQVMVDENRDTNGQYILTGSHQPLLMRDVSQSLAGRTSIVTMLPLSVSEVMGVNPGISTDELMVRGFMPELYKAAIDPFGYYGDYFATYISRDVRQIVNIHETAAFQRFTTLLAGRVGQPVNLSALCGETGVSSATLAGWLSILEASFIVIRIQPWFTNISKRIVRTPKIYFTETGLAAYLIGIKNPGQMSRDPLRGQLFENMVMIDILKQHFNAGDEPRLFTLRTGRGFEIDAVMQQGRQLRPVEIKSAMTYRPEFANNILRFASKEKSMEVVRPTVVYDGDTMTFSNGVEAVNFRDFKVDG